MTSSFVVVATVFLSSTVAFVSPTNAKMAMVLSSDLTVRGPDGDTIDTGLEFGTIIEVEPGEDNTFSLKLNGSIAVAEGAALAVEVDDNGCLALTLEQAFETPDLFDELAISGTEEQDYFGPSLDLSLQASAELAAGVELCLMVDRPVILKPSSTSSDWLDTPQSMAVVGFWQRPTDKSDGPRTRLRISPRFSAAGQLNAKLEAYCVDAERSQPDDGDRFVMETPVTDNRLVQVLSNSHDLPPATLVWCVWAARSFTERFVSDFARKEIAAFDDTSVDWTVDDIVDDVLDKQQFYVNRCPAMIDVFDRYEPWDVDKLRNLIAAANEDRP